VPDDVLTSLNLFSEYGQLLTNSELLLDVCQQKVKKIRMLDML